MLWIQSKKIYKSTHRRCLDGWFLFFTTCLLLVSLNAHAAVNDFTGEFANANWTAGVQVFGCGSSSVTENSTNITIETANNCASIGANYTHTNSGGGASRAGTASFSYSVTETQSHSYTALYGISGGQLQPSQTVRRYRDQLLSLFSLVNKLSLL
ncbi:hypothetical protein [Desulfomarina profundi]|uniref:hypothetical protein n=1 Tax=Desulfomarina profundi TaxID=2772557 RepID=UPI001E584A5C|nr:hypothetical protein [Desulfomarina profundi]